MIKRYANMRGTSFVCHLKGNSSGNIVQTLVKSQATRTRVANAVVCAKAVADSKAKPDVSKEETLWEEVGYSVLEYADRKEGVPNNGGR